MLLTGLIFLLLTLAVRSDRDAGRIHGLYLNAEEQCGWRILTPRRYINRRVGLLNAPGLPDKHGLLIRGRSVHMNGMLFPLDLIALDGTGRVLQVNSSVAPDARVPSMPKSTTNILEIAAGQSAVLALKPGDHLSFGDPR